MTRNIPRAQPRTLPPESQMRLSRPMAAERRARPYAPRVPQSRRPTRAQIEGTVALLWLAIVGIAFVAAMLGHPL